MDKSSKILSDITIFAKYAKFDKKKQRRETWEELCYRNMAMQLSKYPQLFQEILDVYNNYVIPKKVLPSMRALQFGGKPIELSPNRAYNCFSADTEFVTSTGTKAFSDFKNGETVLVPTHTGEWKEAVVKSYGKQKLQEIEFRRGNSIKKVKATANHRWLLRNGETTSLSEGDVLMKTPDLFQGGKYEDFNPLERLYWCYGYVYGDGTRVQGADGINKYSMVRLCGADSNRYRSRFEEVGFKTSAPASCGGDYFAYTGSYLKTAPNPEIDDVGMIKAFVRGYLDADGQKNPDWYANNELSPYRSIQSSELDHIEFIEKCFEVAGVFISRKEDLTGKESNFGVRPETYRFGISSVIGSLKNSHTNWSVKSITPLSEETVWCLEVKDNKSFILSGGIVTGNCAYLPIDHYKAFSETMFLLLGGSGVGYSVQSHHVNMLPEIKKPLKSRKYVIADSIVGWADSVKVLFESYMKGKSLPVFDFSDIRDKGAELVTSGGKAPGPEPLKTCLFNIQKMLDRKKDGEKLTTLEAHDIMCFIADAVLSGGIRRAALIALFDIDDNDMLTCKFGSWWEENPQRGRANNSAMVIRHKVTELDFNNLWAKIKASGSGEPGFYFSNNTEWGSNPCCEIALRNNQFCNLTEVNASDIETQADLEARSKAAAFLGTLQAGYTDFYYLRDIWKKNTEKDALIGVGMTGIASGAILPLDLVAASQVVKDENERVAKIININIAARTTCIKPSGTTSLVVGSSSGIHAWHSEYYIRNIRFGKNEAIYKYLLANHPELVQDEYFRPDSQCVVGIPVKAPTGSLYRSESAIDLLERIKKFSREWIKPGHRKGDNTHNVSATISIGNDEWGPVGKWMWENREVYNGLSVLPRNDHTYVQAPFEECTKERYEELYAKLEQVDLTKVVEEDDNTSLNDQAACAGGACEV